MLEKLFPPTKLDTEQEDLEHLGHQIAVGQLIKDSPVLQDYLNKSVNNIARQLIDAKLLAAPPEQAKAHYIQCINQIRAFEHLMDLGHKLEENQDVFTQRTTPQE